MRKLSTKFKRANVLASAAAAAETYFHSITGGKFEDKFVRSARTHSAGTCKSSKQASGRDHITSVSQSVSQTERWKRKRKGHLARGEYVSISFHFANTR